MPTTVDEVAVATVRPGEPVLSRPEPTHRRMARWVPALVTAARPRQWPKNLLVLAAPLAARVMGRPGSLLATLGATAAFTVAASGVYLINDTLDRDRDRLHPLKRYRPVASGRLPVALAAGVGIGLVVGAVAGTALLSSAATTLVIAGYVAMSIAYSLGLKRLAWVDLIIVTTGFVLRPLAGAFAVAVPVSGWFLAVSCCAALFVVTAKRQAELQLLGPTAFAHRAALRGYGLRRLRRTRDLAQVGTVVAYLGWALTRPSAAGRWWETASAVFVAAALWRYARHNDAGSGGAPEDALFGDHVLQGFGVAFAGLFLVGLGGV